MIDSVTTILQALGQSLLQWRHDGGQDGHWEGTQFKAKADMAAHTALTAALNGIDRTIPVLSEEVAEAIRDVRPPKYFLIDPIDGTASYAHGFSGFVTQVALIEAGRPVLGVVHAPAQGKTWSAEMDKGAWLNGRRLRCQKPSGRLLLTDNYPEPRGIAKTLVEQLPATGYVESGSIALKACLVADGTADLFVKDVILRDWDIAPADLILAEAGGWLTDASGKPFVYAGSVEKNGVVAAADPTVARTALTILSQRVST